MTKKEYCLNNEAVAVHDYYKIQIHGIEYGINDYIYLSRIYQKTVCGKSCVSFHKLKINYDVNGLAYINLTEKYFNGKKHRIELYLDDFIRTKVWHIGFITCNELKAFCN